MTPAVEVDIEGALEEIVSTVLLVLAVPFVLVVGAVWVRRARRE